jgi:hypothetical protein
MTVMILTLVMLVGCVIEREIFEWQGWSQLWFFLGMVAL